MPENKNSISKKKISVTLSMVALNLVIGSLVAFFKLPIYLDSIGIVIATLLCGWSYGMLCAVLTVAVGFFIINPYLPFYALTSILIVLTVYLLRRANMYSSIFKSLISGLVVATVSAIASAPVTAYLFGGATLSGNDALTAYFVSLGNDIVNAVFFSGMSSEAVDKCIVSIASYQILSSLPSRFVQKHELNNFRSEA